MLLSRPAVTEAAGVAHGDDFTDPANRRMLPGPEWAEGGAAPIGTAPPHLLGPWRPASAAGKVAAPHRAGERTVTGFERSGVHGH
jgi:hypothetical protein